MPHGIVCTHKGSQGSQEQSIDEQIDNVKTTSVRSPIDKWKTTKVRYIALHIMNKMTQGK